MYSIMLVGDLMLFNQFNALSLINKCFKKINATQCSDLSVALEKLKEKPCDLIIEDMESGKDNGANLLSICKKEGLCNCVIIIDKKLDYNIARKAISYNAFDYLLKPVESFELLKVCNNALEYIDNNRQSDYNYCLKNALALAVSNADNVLISNVLLNIEKEIKTDYINLVMSSLIIMEISEYVHKFICKHYVWIDDFNEDFNNYQKKIKKSKSLNIQLFFFEEYIRETAVKIKLLYKCANNDKNMIMICDYILNHYNEKISQQDIANLCYFNKSYLSHIFKEKTGISFSEYVTLVKITRAKKLIKENEYTIFKIADMIGIDDADYFCKKFKAMIGMTPKQYQIKQRRFCSIYN